ncbi:MAG: hypothetical protein MJY90_01050 [Bacteroidaceae bacterium]|nr:hypothetical protein [Bacteroidaceae bacterium]
MKKMFFYLLACALPAIALTSCGSDDDDDPGTQYAWGIQQSGSESYSVNENKEASPTFEWLKDEVANLQKANSGKGKFETDDQALAKYSEGNKALSDLQAKLNQRLKTHDACGLSFDIAYIAFVSKNGKNLKESQKYEYKYEYKGSRLNTKKKVELNISKDFDKSKVLMNDIVIPCSELGLTDSKTMNINLGEKDILFVESSSHEFQEGLPFETIKIVENEKGNGHDVVLSYNFDKETYDNWKGQWYILLPIHISDGQGGLTFDVKINVTIK